MMEIEVLVRFASAVKMEIRGEEGRKEKEAKFKDGKVSLRLFIKLTPPELSISRSISRS